MHQLELVTLDPQPVLAIHDHAADLDPRILASQLHEEVRGDLSARGMTGPGRPFTMIRHDHGPGICLHAGWLTPVAIAGRGRSMAGLLPGGTAVRGRASGPHGHLSDLHDALLAYLRRHRLTQASPVWEVYLNGPHADPDMSAWQTELYVAVHPRALRTSRRPRLSSAA